MKTELSRRELLFEESPRIWLKLLLLPSALTGLAKLVFGDEDYLSKLPPLNGRKVTEELIEEMLNVGSVRGILEKYGNKENIFYVQFQPDGRNNLDELVKKEPEKWDGSYVLVDGNTSDVINPLVHSAVVVFLSHRKKGAKFVFYDLLKDIGADRDTSNKNEPRKFAISKSHFLVRAFSNYFKPNSSERLSSPIKLVYSKNGKLLDGGDGYNVPEGAVTIKKDSYLWKTFYNETIWLEHWLYRMHTIDDDGTKIKIFYGFGKKLKKEVINEENK